MTPELLGRSPAILRVQELVRVAAAARSHVLITAEAGVSVSSVARELHCLGDRPGGPFVVVGGEGFDAGACERLLLGGPVEEGASDVERAAAGSCLAAARGGTLFFESVTDLPAGVQHRLARVLRDGEVRIDGHLVALDCRVIGGAPDGIDAEVHAHRFRADLYRRLSAVRIDLPPLRDRAADLPALASRVLQDVTEARGLPGRAFTQATLALAGALTWPGNLAELIATVERVVASTDETLIQIEHLLPALRLDRAATPFVPAGTLRDARLRFERDYIAAVLQHHQWRMAEAARTLGIQRPNLYRKVRQLGIPLARASE